MVLTVCYRFGMDRPTKELKTPSGNVIVLKEYLTGREKRELTNIFFGKNLTLSPEGGVEGLSADAINAAQDLAFKTVIVSIDGKTENIVDTILDMKAEDYSAIVVAVNEISNDATFAKKKTT